MESQIMKRQTTLTQLPPRRGLVKIRVVKSLIRSMTAFAYGDGGRNNGIDDGGDSASRTPPIPNGYNSDENN
ncbi:unnamed protein product [Lathyrus sativus]|nr:unnamed protein product [Lathyrus sativus]